MFKEYNDFDHVRDVIAPVACDHTYANIIISNESIFGTCL